MGFREALKKQKEGFKQAGERIKSTRPYKKTKKFFKIEGKGVKSNPFAGITQPAGYKPKPKVKKRKSRRKKSKK